MRNARFWIYHEGADGEGSMVKLTLRPGQSVEFVSGGPDEEGWSYRRDTYEHAGDRVITTYESSGADCDGRYSRACALECPLERLSAYHNTHTGLDQPDWVEAGSWQRDHEAEKAGY